MNKEQIVNSIIIFKSLADETRLSIVRRLAKETQEIPSNEIVVSCATHLQLSQPAMSHHFNKLVAAGVILERKAGVTKFYLLNRELLESIGITPEKL